MLYLIGYALHMLVSFLFFLLIPFPFLIKGSLLDEPGRFVLLLRIYKRIIWLAHGGVIIALISGFMMSTQWLSVWFVSVLIIWLFLSALLGMTAKMVRIILEKKEEHAKTEEEVHKLRLYSLFLMFGIITMFFVKFILYI
ncbi:hypothetical protein ACFFHM_09875 [Halalkalibacter kiskunsagensis]|uniref:DUF2269 family protein n=1 Tax=Halalkalibacter kiskunsagensis TaxID=1548599 RepID=A0ABV6KG29_9BACI